MKTMKRVITFLLIVVFCISAAATATAAHAVEISLVNSTPFSGYVDDGTRYGSQARVYCSTQNYWKYLWYGGVYDDTAISTTIDISFDNNAQRQAIGYCYTDSTGQTAADAWLHIYMTV